MVKSEEEVVCLPSSLSTLLLFKDLFYDFRLCVFVYLGGYIPTNEGACGSQKRVLGTPGVADTGGGELPCVGASNLGPLEEQCARSAAGPPLQPSFLS